MNINSQIITAAKTVEQLASDLARLANDYEKARKELQQKLTLATIELSTLTGFLAK
jgi:outer membrane murein-binding lipoprotein Lpp